MALLTPEILQEAAPRLQGAISNPLEIGVCGLLAPRAGWQDRPHTPGQHMDPLHVPRESGIRPCPSFHSPLSSGTNAAAGPRGGCSRRSPEQEAGFFHAGDQPASSLQRSRPAFRPRSSDRVQMTAAQPGRPASPALSRPGCCLPRSAVVGD